MSPWRPTAARRATRSCSRESTGPRSSSELSAMSAHARSCVLTPTWSRWSSAVTLATRPTRTLLRSLRTSRGWSPPNEHQPPRVADALARIQRDQVLTGDEAVGRACHRLDRDRLTAFGRRERVAGEHVVDLRAAERAGLPEIERGSGDVPGPPGWDAAVIGRQPPRRRDRQHVI